MSDAPQNGTLAHLIATMSAIQARQGEIAQSLGGLRDDLRDGLRDVRADGQRTRDDVAEVRAHVRTVDARLGEIEGHRTTVAAVDASVSVDIPVERRATERARDAAAQRRTTIIVAALGSLGAILTGLSVLIGNAGGGT